MIRQCMKCLKIMGEKPPLSDTSITHGVCDKCMELYMKEIAKTHKVMGVK